MIFYKTSTFFFIVFCWTLCSAVVAQSTLSGRVVNSDREALIGATIRLAKQDSNIQIVSTDLDGYFVFENLSEGLYALHCSFLGMQTHQQDILLLKSEQTDCGIIEMHTNAVLDEIIVKNQASNQASHSKIAPTVALKHVISPSTLANVFAPSNLIESISLVNGLQENVACGVCFTNNISINGLPGQYAAILIDGTPMYGNLASVYALNGLATTMIDRIEVSKGPSSTIFGSEAVAGAINIITKDPSKEPLIALDIKTTSLLESISNFSLNQQFGRFNTSIGLHHSYAGTFFDRNKDGFGDLINLDRFSVFTKLTIDRKKNRKASIFARYYYEDRRNGVEQYLSQRNYLHLRGHDAVYGESIFTQRWEVLGTYDLPTEEYFKLDYSVSGHYQDSYYGADYYRAQQHIAYTNLNWNKYLKGHGITAGLTLRYQHYDDNTIATQDSSGNNIQSHQFIPGIFVQDAWDISKKVALLYGCRLDYYKDHQLIPAPRLNLKYQPDTWTTLRFNFGTGFRIVNLFSEDHAFVTGNRSLEIADELNPEQSYNASISLHHVFHMGPSQGSFNIEGFYTYFTNAIFPDYSQNNRIIYKNLDGFAQTRGFSFGYNQQFKFPLSISLNYNMQWADQTNKAEDGSKSTQPLEYSPLYSGNLLIQYKIKKWDLIVAYTGILTGPMQLPEVYDINSTGHTNSQPRPTVSTPFGLHNLQITKEFCKINLSIYAGVENLLDYRQPYSPLAGFDAPDAPAGFSESFDTAYAYGPVEGRRFYVGVRWKWAK